MSVMTPDNPTPEQVRAARAAAGLTQTAAAAVVHSTLSGWQRWEQGERKMHPGLWELFQIKTGLPVCTEEMRAIV